MRTVHAFVLTAAYLLTALFSLSVSAKTLQSQVAALQTLQTEQTLESSDWFETLDSAQDTKPDHLTQLHQAYEHYQTIAKDRAWPKLGRGPLLSFGDEHPQVPILREMLIRLGDLEQGPCEDLTQLFDIELHEALMRFQTRHGGKIDGILGPSSRRQLNITPQARADQILLNIYRISQFEPKAEHYIRVNVPDYRLHLMEDGAEALTMKTIVGKRKRKTPIFETEIDRVVVNPSWHVPKSIAYKDILPKMKEDADFLRKMNLKLVIGWGHNKQFIDPANLDMDKLYQGKHYQRFWEPPSDRNTLGKVKFLTSSRYSIYLHDTSAKQLFNEHKRAFSSGCIRVEQPKLLADALLNLGNNWSEAQVTPLFSQQETHEVKLANPIKLHVTYWTSWIDDEGLLHFRDDLYRRDRYELSQLKKQSAQEIFISSN